MDVEEPLPRVPGFDVLEPLGAGGRGEIYIARDEEAEGRLVALKLLRQEDLEHEDRVRAFLDEVRVSSLLDHPTIVRVYRGGFVGPKPYLAMELVDGVTLWELLERGRRAERPMPQGVAAYIAVMVADALGYAHDLEGPDGEPLGLIHRDVSTVNIMITFDGAVKLLDFGIARSKLSSMRTAPGIVKGKLDYISPEQCAGKPADARTDIYALGVVLYEALTGKRPYSDEKVAEIFRKVSKGERVKVHRLRPDVSPRMERIVDRCMAVKPTQRYGSAAALAKDLRALMARLPSRPTSTTVADLIRTLAPPARLGRIQDRYGPPDTTDVASFEAAAPAMLAPVAPGPEPREPEPPEPSAAPPGPPVALPREDDPTEPEVPLEEDSPTVDQQRPPARSGSAIRRFLVALVALSLLGVTAGMAVTAIVLERRRGGSVDPASARIFALPAVDGGLAELPRRDAAEVDAPPYDPDLELLRPLSPDAGADAALDGAAPSPDGGEVDAPDGREAGALDGGEAPSLDAEPPPAADGATPQGDAGGDGSAEGRALLTVESRRPAMVFVGRERIGLTPVERLSLPPGRYMVKVRSRHGVRRRQVDLAAGAEERITFDF